VPQRFVVRWGYITSNPESKHRIGSTPDKWSTFNTQKHERAAGIVARILTEYYDGTYSAQISTSRACSGPLNSLSNDESGMQTSSSKEYHEYLSFQAVIQGQVHELRPQPVPIDIRIKSMLRNFNRWESNLKRWGEKVKQTDCVSLETIQTLSLCQVRGGGWWRCFWPRSLIFTSFLPRRIVIFNNLSQYYLQKLTSINIYKISRFSDLTTSLV
jgi:hypothetical protein